MKKIILVFLLIFIFILPLSSQINVNAKSKSNISIQTPKPDIDNIVSIVKIYKCFDEMIKAGEQIFYEDENYSGYLLFKSAYRIGKTEKFTVTYVSSFDD